MSWGEFICRVEGWKRAKKEKLYDLRMLLLYIRQGYSKKALKPDDIFKIREPGKKAKPISKEDYKRELDKFSIVA
jgi:hypothetical protein